MEHLFSPGELMLIATYHSSLRLVAHVLEARGNEYWVRLRLQRPLRHGRS